MGSTREGSPLRLGRLLRVTGGLQPTSCATMRAAVQSQRGGDVKSSSPRRGFAVRLQKSQPAGAATYVPSFDSADRLKNMNAPSPAPKKHAHEIHEKAGSTSNTCKLPWPVRGDMKKRLQYQQGLCRGEPDKCLGYYR